MTDPLKQSLSPIAWAGPDEYDRVREESRRTGKPILLDLHLPSCSGCRSLDSDVYASPEVASAVREATLPLRANLENPGPSATRIIDNHIFIWSPTVQLISPDGTRYHEFNGAPRHTRHSVGYAATHGDYDGNLTPARFLAQLAIGRGKASLANKHHGQALAHFEGTLKRHSDDLVASREAHYWSDVICHPQADSRSFAREALIGRTPLARAVEKLAYAVAAVPDEASMTRWQGAPGSGDWKWYSDCLREITLQAYQELLDFAVEAENTRPAPTTAHRLLAQSQVAYREFQGAFIGVDDAALDRMPFRNERSLRENLAHVILAEWWAYRPQIAHAVERSRAGLPLTTMPASDVVSTHGEPVATFEPIHELLSRYEELHVKAFAEFATFTDEDLAARSQWWEAEPVEVRFRLKRLCWHLRDHAVTVERILDSIGHMRTANEMFAWRLFSGLGVAEGALIGASETLAKRQSGLIDWLEQRAREVNSIERGN